MSKTPKSPQNPGLEAAVSLLMADHDLVRGLFRDYKRLMDYDAPAAERGDLAQRICNALAIHAAAEDEVFYPAARAVLAEDAEECLDHAEVEHASITRLIAEIRSASPEDPLYDARVHVLCEYVAHHVAEEEGEMFAELRQEEADLPGVAEAMAAMRSGWDRYVGEAVEGAAQRPRYEASAGRPAGPAGGGGGTGQDGRARVSRAMARKAVTRQGSRKRGPAATGSK